MNESVVRSALRGAAVAIGIAAVIDPSVSSERPVKPVVVVSVLDPTRDAALSDALANAIDDRYTVTRAPVAGSSATILVGNQLPRKGDELATPVFVLLPDTVAPRIAIERLDVPPIVSRDARVPVIALVSVQGADGRDMEVTLRAGGSVAERLSRRLVASDTVVAFRMSFIPTDTGALRLHVAVTLSNATATAVADAGVDVRSRPFAVLFFDPRPSWTSTFVRRAIERDARFVVASRIVTSRSVSSSSGRAPARLADAASLSSFDAIVVGAPEALSAADVIGLDAFMRRRGGSVVLLLDGRAPGPHDRLTGVTAWSSSRTPLVSSQSDSAALRATDVVWPNVLPPGATTILGGEHPVVWESSVGPGRLFVSGALDAWRYRDPAVSGFDRFWRGLVADAASVSPPPVSVLVSHAVAVPNELIEIRALVRDAAFAPVFRTVGSSVVHSSVAAMLSDGTVATLWPEAEPGYWRGVVRAPVMPGAHRIVVTTDAGAGSAPIIVANDFHRPTPTSRGLLGPWATAHGGKAVPAGDVAGLSAALRRDIRPPSRTVTWHPMHSAWWIVPFVLALSLEWWLRRRRGLR